MNIGILGGTFDPPHNGHLVIAESARAQLDLERVYFVPAREPPHKIGEPVTPLEHRVAMLRLALDEHPFFVLSLIEANRSGLSYSVDTLRAFRAEFPPPTELYFIMGLDSLASLPTWHQPREIIKYAKLAVLKRPGYSVDLDALEQRIPGLQARVVFIPAHELEISSTDLQTRVRAGESIDDLVPHAVAEYISAHHLYEDG